MEETEKYNILIVDNVPASLHVLEGLLQDSDFNILKAASEKDAVNMTLEHPVAAVLLDLQLSGLDGFKTAELIRMNEGTKQIPIIFLSAINKDLEYMFRGYQEGPVNYVFKPLNEDILRNKVNLFIEIQKQKRALEKINRDLLLTVAELKEANQRVLEQQRSVIEEERLKILLQLSGATAHELNQPLTYLLGNIELLKIDKDKPENYFSYVDKIQVAGRRISEIVNKMNSLHRYETKPYSGNTEIINFYQKTNILSVEDSDQDYRKICDILKDIELITITRAKGVNEAFSALKQNTFDIVLMDYVLTDGTGLELLEKMTESGMDIPVIAITGKGDELVASHLIKSGAQDYLPKTKINKSSLIRSINNSLEKHRLQQNIRMANQKMAELAIKDELTGLYNRRYFIEALENETERAKRYKTGLALCMMDLDYFKRINDNYGHPAGDLVLSGIGKIIKETIRISDLACRYGGEEFSIIFPNINIEDARSVCERIRQRLAEQKFEYPPFLFQISLSAGIALFQGDLMQTGDDLVGEADKALLKAKKEGRNRVVV
jgi:two-component system, cell cycle response regulator